ncbi:MAG TPA: choice-of-anchor B family protein [Gemmatimonadales bacterium]
MALGLTLIACGGEAPGDPVPVDSLPTTTDSAVASISIEPGSIAFGAIGSSVALRAVAQNAAGDTLDGVALHWSVAGDLVAQVSSTGLLVSVGNGTDTVTVTSDSLAAAVPVQVRQVPVQLRIASHPAMLTVMGTSLVLTASALDSTDHPIDGHPITWASSDPSVLPIDPDGRVVATSAGAATITATSSPLSATTSVAVGVSGPFGGPIRGAVVNCNGSKAASFYCNGIDLLSYLPVSAIGGGPGVALSDMWGWTDPTTGAEYAIVGRTDGTAFIDVSDPLNPVYRGDLLRTAGTAARWWRDMKVYDDHAYIVADAAGAHGIQVFDLRQLRTPGPPLRYVETAHYSGVTATHNIAINEQSGFAYAVGTSQCGGGLHMIDVRTPLNPVFAGCFADSLTGFGGTGYTHDVQCIVYDGPDPDYQGHEVCLGSNESALSIADVTDKANPVAIARVSYPNVQYAHQGWFTDDRRYFFTDDELDEFGGGMAGTRTLIWDVSDLDDPVLANEYFGPTTATDHNLYIVGNRLYQSNYQYGIRVLDIGDPAQPVELGFFDTAPTRPNTPGFDGSWSNYPFFASGIIVVTSADEGLFVLKVR